MSMTDKKSGKLKHVEWRKRERKTISYGQTNGLVNLAFTDEGVHLCRLLIVDLSYILYLKKRGSKPSFLSASALGYAGVQFTWPKFPPENLPRKSS